MFCAQRYARKMPAECAVAASAFVGQRNRDAAIERHCCCSRRMYAPQYTLSIPREE